MLTAVVLGLTLVAAATDLRWGKIYNWNTYPGILGGPLLRWLLDGPAGLEDGLLGFLLCGGILLFSFVLFPVGGGDVKLLAMTGACLGVRQGLETLLWTFVLGGAGALIYLIWQEGALALGRQAFQQVAWWLTFRSARPRTERERRLWHTRLFLAPAACLAVAVVRFDLDDLLGLG